MSYVPIAADLARRATEQAINDPRPPRASRLRRLIEAWREEPQPR